MVDLKALRQNRAAVADKLSKMTLSATSTEEEITAHEELVAEGKKLDRLIASAEEAEGIRARAAQTPATNPAGDEPRDPNANNGVRPQAKDQPMEKGILFAQITRSLITVKGNVEAAQKFAVATWGESSPAAMELGAVMHANDAGSGGLLIPEHVSSELIDLLLPRTVVRRACSENGNVVPLVGGTDLIPTVESGTTAYYIGEGQDLTTSEPTFGNLKMVEREMAALVPISNKLIRHASRNVDAMVRDLLVRGMAVTEDQAFIRSTGVGASPKGLRYAIAASNITGANATVNLANVETDARKAELFLMNADIPMIDPRWVLAPRTFTYLRDLRDGNGNIVFPTLSREVPTWRGYKVEMTTSIPINLGGGSDESEVYLQDFAYAMLAQTYAVRIDASESASYMSGGNLVSAYSRNQTIIRALAGHDFGLTRSKSGAVLTGVKWGS